MSADGVLALLVSSAVRGSVVLLLVLAAAVIGRKASASARNALLAGGLLVQLALPLGVSISPSLAPSQALGVALVRTEAQLLQSLRRASPITSSTVVSEASRSVTFARIAVGIWAIGALAVLGWLLLGRARVRRIQHGLTAVSSGALRDALDVAAAQIGETRSITLFVGGPFTVPLTWGIRRPVVLLPLASKTWSAEQVELALAHELAHVRRGDVALHLLAGVALACFWFHPLVWLARRLQRTTAERAADDSVLQSGARASHYVDALVTMVKESQATTLSGAAMAMARRSEFEGRMLAVLNEEVVRAPANGKHFLRAAVLLGLVSVPIAALPLPRSLASVNAAVQTAQGGEPRLEIAAKLFGTERGVFLRKVAASVRLVGSDVSRYLTLAQELDSIERPLAVQALLRSTTFSAEQVDVVLQLLEGLRGDVMTATTLAALAQSQSLSSAQRDAYHAIAARLQGGALRTALDALP